MLCTISFGCSTYQLGAAPSPTAKTTQGQDDAEDAAPPRYFISTIGAPAQHDLDLGELTLAMRQRLEAAGLERPVWGVAQLPSQYQLICQVTQVRSDAFAQQLQVEATLSCQSEPAVTGALIQVAGRSTGLLPDDLSSGTLHKVERQLKLQAILSAIDTGAGPLARALKDAP